MKYSAINIGPIVATLSIARKPRELWAASFLFSHLMKCIYSEMEKSGGKIISPAKPKVEKNKVGIYPDRIYVEGEIDAKQVIADAVLQFYTDLLGKSPDKGKNPDLRYFNLMSVSCEAEKESLAIANLNQQLDILELCNYAADGDASYSDPIQSIYEIISEKKNSPLFELADGKYIKNIMTLEDIAKAQKNANKDVKEKSHHRYFCVVQADGDNVGKTVSHKDLPNGKVMEISTELVQFGLNATELIEEYGGLPIYAGGDDLLFIAPVIGKNNEHIFQLLDAIENEAFKGVKEKVDTIELMDKQNNPIKASLSFGVAMTYYKYPLYEALETARNLLFGKAKGIDEKKAVAWSLRKHSGGTFEAAFTLKNEELKKQFEKLIEVTEDNKTISAIAHKLRQEEALVDIVLDAKDNGRLNTLFEKVLEFDQSKADYFNAVKDIMPTLYSVVKKEDYIKTLYSLLRTAKFIKGEDLHDE